MVRNSPVALRVLKASLNAAEDGYAGISELAGSATMLFYQTPEGKEVRFPPVVPGFGLAIASCTGSNPVEG